MYVEGSWVKELGKLIVRVFVIVFQVVWKWVGARGGLQEIEEYGAGFQGWYWRGGVFSFPAPYGRRGTRVGRV